MGIFSIFTIFYKSTILFFLCKKIFEFIVTNSKNILILLINLINVLFFLNLDSLLFFHLKRLNIMKYPEDKKGGGFI